MAWAVLRYKASEERRKIEDFRRLQAENGTASSCLLPCAMIGVLLTKLLSEIAEPDFRTSSLGIWPPQTRAHTVLSTLDSESVIQEERCYYLPNSRRSQIPSFALVRILFSQTNTYLDGHMLNTPTRQCDNRLSDIVASARPLMTLELNARGSNSSTDVAELVIQNRLGTKAVASFQIKCGDSLKLSPIV